jgi:hypothetical protein
MLGAKQLAFNFQPPAQQHLTSKPTVLAVSLSSLRIKTVSGKYDKEVGININTVGAAWWQL